MRQTLLSLLLLAIAYSLSVAQQIPQYSLFSHIEYTYNPAYGGMEDALYLSALHRSQWVGLEGAPSGQMVSAHLPLYFTGGGMGLIFENDEIGANRFIRLGASYNQMINLGNESVLSIGFRGSFLQRSLDGTILLTPQGSLPGEPLELRDDLLSETSQTASAINFGAGIFYRLKNLEAGIAVENMSESVIDFNQTNGIDFQSKRHFFATLSYNFYTGEAVQWEPAIIAKSDLVKTQADFVMRATYQGTFFVGGGIRGYDDISFDAALLQMGVTFSNNLTLAYGFDIPLSDLQTSHSGSHEVLVAYKLNQSIGKGRKPKVIYNPRLL